MFQSTYGPDLASAIAGAYVVAVYRAMYITAYRLDHVHQDTVNRHAATTLAR
jgi:hypothetical protein